MHMFIFPVALAATQVQNPDISLSLPGCLGRVRPLKIKCLLNKRNDGFNWKLTLILTLKSQCFLLLGYQKKKLKKQRFCSQLHLGAVGLEIT